VLEECTIEEQRSVVRFLWGTGLNAQIIHKEYFLFTVGNVCRVRRLTTGSRNFLKGFRKSQMMPDQVRRWLRKQSKDLYSAGFNALVKRWDKCNSVSGGYVEKYMFFFRFEHHMFYVLYHFVIYLLTLPRIWFGTLIHFVKILKTKKPHSDIKKGMYLLRYLSRF
jgi:hypothetical protein